MEVIESNKRGAKLCHAGYMYTKTAVRKNKIWWKCSKRASLHCCASVSTSLDSKNPVPRILHNHGPEEAEIEYAKFRNLRRRKTEEKKTKNSRIEQYLGNDNIYNNNDDNSAQGQLQIIHQVDDSQKNNNNHINNQMKRNNMKFLHHRRRKKENSQKNSARDLTQTRSPFLSSILGAKGPIRHSPNNMAIQRLNHPVLKSCGLQPKRQQLSENGQNLFSHLQMNFASNTDTKGHNIKRPAPVSVAEIELRDIKPCKRELDTHSQMTTSPHAYPQVTTAQQNHLQLPTSHQNHHQAVTSHHQVTASHQNHHQAATSHHQVTVSHQNHHQATPSHQNHHQATPSHQNHHQATPSHQSHQKATASHQNHQQATASHQSNPVAQSGQQGHSQMTIVSQNHHATSGQLNHQMSVGQHNYPKTNNAGHLNAFQVPTSKVSHQMTPAHRNHQNITMSHQNPHQVTTGQSMVTDQQTQPQISTGHQKGQQLSPAQLRFLETSSSRQNRIEGNTGQQPSETVQDSLKTVPEVLPDSRLKPSSTSEVIFSTSGSKQSPVPQMNKKTFIVSKHHSTVMSSLASLWKDSKLCDATIGNTNFKIMVHKVVLLAISPKLLSQADIKANCFIRVNLPEDVSQAALVAFSEYMYHGVLTLDPVLLQQLRTIALQLGIRELELLCDTHLLYCDLQNSAVNSGLNFPQTSPSSLLESTPEVPTSADPPQRISAMPEFTTVKQEVICEELALNSIKEEPVDHTSDSSASAQNILNSPISRNFNNDLLDTNYKQQNLEASTLCEPYNDAFHSSPPEFEPSTTQLRQGAADCLIDLNDLLQIQKLFKKSDLTNLGSSDCYDKSALSLSQSNDLGDHSEMSYNNNSYATNTDNCGEQSKKLPVIASSRRTSQPLEVLKESAELLTFQITDVRSVPQTVDLT